MGFTLGATYRSKLGVHEISELILSGVFFEDAWDSNFEGEGPGEGKTMGIFKKVTYSGIREVPDGEV